MIENEIISVDRISVYLSAENVMGMQKCQNHAGPAWNRGLKINNQIANAILEPFQPLDGTDPAGFNLPLALHPKYPSELHTSNKDPLEIHFVFFSRQGCGRLWLGVRSRREKYKK